MDYKIDVHTHSIVSGHAYSSLLENIDEASKKGIKILGTSEHGPTMPGAPHIFYFGNLHSVPRYINGVTVLRGCEANIISYDGKLDIPFGIQKQLDYIIASLHDVCLVPGSVSENTEALLSVMENPLVDIIGHMGNPSFPVREEEVIKKARQMNKIIEINSSSPKSRKGSKETCLKVAELCKKHEVSVILSSDAHISFSIGNFTEAENILKTVEMPASLIINEDWKRFITYLKNKDKLSDLTID